MTAFRSGGGAAAEVIRLTLAGEISVLLDLNLALEYRDVLLPPEQIQACGRSVEETLFLLTQIEALAEAVETIESYRPLSADPNDDMVLNLAINGLAEMIVTYNLRHFIDPARRFGIDAVTPRELPMRMARKGS